MECDFCKVGLTSHCQTLGGIGWIFGHLINGTLAEYVRVPFADHGLIALPEGVSGAGSDVIEEVQQRRTRLRSRDGGRWHPRDLHHGA